MPAVETSLIKSLMILLLALDAALAHVGDDRVDAVLIDNSHALGGYAQFYPAILGLDPEFMSMQVWQKTPTRLVMSVRNVVSANRFLPCYLTDPGHGGAPLNARID